ncbi:ABC transporter ATP-binding protein [Serinibacter salmoneus]|uniref:Nucleoside ABC transporter ATP-binding protein n=1 Tax=Serinibacter salmoneus TaxID=556530 RepID=A0A2A9CXB5_9MICO|nr:ABC transporter ATP-binding protein [Serinibacter salmoneus]PFG19077.1 nucleoside ABC transporter ATP-binding protein [Serinibacter salmoneus]
MKLELDAVTKRFGSFTANDRISLTVQPGEIHAILGENGAGKSTMMNTIFGLYQPDGGRILLDDEPVSFDGPGDAMRAGIGMVHQHFMLVPVFTVAENVVLGSEPVKGGGIIDIKKARERVRELSSMFGFDIDPDALVEDLPVGAQQRVEIIKALSRDASVLILDEPTAVLTPQETDELIAIMRRLKEAGTSIIFITHKLREVRAVADAITVIRLGKVVGSADPSASETELASLMVGRSVTLGVDRPEADPAGTALAIEGLSVRNGAGVEVVKNVSLDVRAGEIVVLAGVQGNGQTELTESILGIQEPAAGRITMGGKDLTKLGVRERLDAGLGFVPEDRSTDGVVADFTIVENLVLDRVGAKPYSRGGALEMSRLRSHATEKVAEYDVRTTSIDQTLASLSGGNQQKVVLARELSHDLTALVASQPTRGLDVGSIEFVHKQFVAARDAGAAVLIVSTELDEVLALGDRIAVMCAGRLVGVVPGGTDRDVLGLMMAGVPAEEAYEQARSHHTTLGGNDTDDEIDVQHEIQQEEGSADE